MNSTDMPDAPARKTPLILTLVHGMLMGVANIIPGVSGGTLALVLGIYERFIEAVHNIDADFVKTKLRWLRSPRKGWPELQAALVRIDAYFLGLITVGAIVAIYLLSETMDMLLVDHHAASYAFFFGLILASIIVPYRHLKSRGPTQIASCVLAIVLVVMMSLGVSDEEKIERAESKQERDRVEQVAAEPTGILDRISTEVLPTRELVKIFLVAGVAMSAMVLPGVSGSFMLLLFGCYFQVLGAISRLEIVTLAVIMLGAVVGLLIVVRIVNWCLARFHDATMAFMVGLMVGSLWELWPFKSTAMVGDATVYLRNTTPGASGEPLLMAMVMALMGVAIVSGFIWFESRNSRGAQA